MAYTEEQKRDHIRELQQMLYALSYHDERIPQVIPDGIYGAETALAVRAFQQANGLRPTGETNRATWDAIVNAYLENVAQIARAIDAYPQSAEHLSLGDEGLAVYIIQAMLNLLSITYGNFSSIPITGKYDEETHNAVREFQRRSGQPETGNVNPATWNLLAATTQHTN